MKVLRFELDDQSYSVRVSFKDDYTLYAIYRDIEYFCSIALNEECICESVENVDQNLVRRYGLLIEEKVSEYGKYSREF